MASPLPHQDKLTVPIQWQGQSTKITMEVGSYTLSGTIGWRPAKESANLEWAVTEAVSAELISAFKATYWNGVYTYDCNQRGTIKVRLTGNYAITEVGNSGSFERTVRLSVGVETV